MTPLPRLLTIAADADFSAGLNAYLAQNGLAVQAGPSVAAMRTPLAAGAFDMVLLDLPDAGPHTLAPVHELRLRTRAPFILFGTEARSAQRVAALDAGAADCLSRPFVPRELLARIRAVLRRATGPTAPTPLRPAEAESLLFGGWVLQTLTRRLTSPSGEVVALTAAEFNLLQTFLRSPQRLLSREQLMARARHREGEPVLRSIDLLVSRLRHKLSCDDACEPLIKTVRGQGYLMDSQPMPLDPLP